MDGYILIVDDEKQFQKLYSDTLAQAGLIVKTASSAEKAADIIADTAPLMVVSDVRMPGDDGITFLKKTRENLPDLPFLLVTAYADVKDAVTALKLGAVDYLSKPVDLDELVTAVSDTLGIGSGEEGFEVPAEALEHIIAESPLMKSAVQDAWRLSSCDAGVLITGESGTGKDVIARFIHENSGRKDKPFVAVNCASIPGTLLSSELFGHKKGSFTGADSDRNGYLVEADGGTLFLDEIGDMPLDLQPALLRAIETGTFMPVGSDRERSSDYRLIVATNHDLKKDVEEGKFREDLYYRINVIALELAPLRERREDILPLARYFISKEKATAKRLSRTASELLSGYSWPGNVRELSNVIQRALVLSASDVIMPEHLPQALNEESVSEAGESRVKTLEESEIDSIRQALLQTDGNKTKAAELLGITRRGLIYKIKRYGI